MNEWFKKFFGTIKEKWGKWTLVQKGIAIGIILAIIVAIVLLITLSSRKTSVKLFNAPVTDESRRTQILTYLSAEGVDAYETSDGYIYVNDAKTAEKYSSQLIVEGLAPTEIDPYSLWKTDKFSIDDFQQNRVNWKQTIELQLTKRLQNLSGIRRADVTLAIPEETLLLSNQNPTTASVTLFAAYGSDALENKKIVKGIQSLILRSVEGLREENITIIDGDTMETINDFEGMAAAEKVDITKKQQALIKNLEAQYSTQVLNQLVGIYGKERVNIANIKIEMDQSDLTEHTEEHFGITLRPDNLDTPYDDSEIVDHLTVSSEIIEKKYEATGYNPEGPAGMEGRNPDVYQDSSNMVGLSTETSRKENNALNTKISDKEVAPTIDRVTVSVIIDGAWRKVYRDGKLSWDPDTGIEYSYTPIPEEDLEKLRDSVRQAVGYNKNRGDQVTVENIAFDHTAEREAENEEYRRKQATRKTVMYVLVSVVVVLVLFILYRVISREVERRRRLKEEEMLRKQQQEREAALWDAKNEGMEVTMSVEERKRAELQENAIAMAKEHPEDVAMLIRTWLMEE